MAEGTEGIEGLEVFEVAEGKSRHAAWLVDHQRGAHQCSSSARTFLQCLMQLECTKGLGFRV